MLTEKAFLIVKTSSLGDVIQAFPTLSFLKKHFPDAPIDWVVEKGCAPLVLAHPLVDSCIVVDTKKWRTLRGWKEIKGVRNRLRERFYETAFDLQGNLKSGLILSQVRAKAKVGFGWKALPEWPNAFFTNYKVLPPKGLSIREEYLYLLKAYFNKKSEGAEFNHVLLRIEEKEAIWLESFFQPSYVPILVSSGSNWPNKRLTKEMMLKVLLHLGKGPYLFTWGNEEEKKEAEWLAELCEGRVLPKVSLPLLQHVMARSRLVVSMDSLSLHLAATTPTPTLGFFGPSSPLKYAPSGPSHRYFQGKCPYGQRFEKRCPYLRTCKTGACLKEVSIEEIVRAL